MKRFFILTLAVIVVFLSASTVSARKRLGFYWDVDSVKYYSNITNSSQRSAISSSMAKWNGVKWQNVCPVTQSLTTDQYCMNTITYESPWFDSWIGYTDVNWDWYTNVIYNVHIKLSTAESFSIGATPSSFDLQSVLTHELGHGLGVAHCHEEGEADPCWSLTCVTNVMRRNISHNVNRRNLTEYDSASFIVIYR